MASRSSGKARGKPKAKASKGAPKKGTRTASRAARPAPAGKPAQAGKPGGRAPRPTRTPARPPAAGTRRGGAAAAAARPAPPPRQVSAPPPPAPPEKGTPLREQVLDRMRQLLLAKRKALVSGVRESSLESIQASAEGIQDIADQASTAYTKEFLLSVGDTERRLLQQVDDALDKIRRKNYGLCEKCGEPVGEKRLEALPFAKLCIRCQEEEERR